MDLKKLPQIIQFFILIYKSKNGITENKIRSDKIGADFAKKYSPPWAKAPGVIPELASLASVCAASRRKYCDLYIVFARTR
jgi:hypothetical protein